MPIAPFFDSLHLSSGFLVEREPRGIGPGAASSISASKAGATPHDFVLRMRPAVAAAGRVNARIGLTVHHRGFELHRALVSHQVFTGNLHRA